jgi:MFS family permease
VFQKRFDGFPGFVIVLAGQFLSLLGSSMTTFALTIWAWQQSGEATVVALLSLAAFAPGILFGSLLGVGIDKWNRKSILIYSDLAVCLGSIALLFLYRTAQLEIWHLFFIVFWSGIFTALQRPTFSAAITMMMPKERYVRANGMRSTAFSLSMILSPALAGAILAFSDLEVILWIDIATFLLAALATLQVTIPQPSKTKTQSSQNLFADASYGFRYLLAQKGLFGLLIAITVFNFVIMIGVILLSPIILIRTNDEISLGIVQSAVGIGGVVGGLMMSIWAGPKYKIYGIIVALALGSFPLLGFGVGQHIIIWVLAAFFTSFFLPIADTLFETINQSIIPPEIQGRVFASSRVIAYIATPLAMIASGVLVDRWLEPAMQREGFLTDNFGHIVGIEPGAGMALLFVVSGILGVIVSVLALLFKPIRELQQYLIDIDRQRSEDKSISATV